MRKEKIKPRAGLTVIKPGNNQAVAAGGETVAWNSYWQRRLNKGDIELVTDKKDKK